MRGLIRLKVSSARSLIDENSQKIKKKFFLGVPSFPREKFIS